MGLAALEKDKDKDNMDLDNLTAPDLGPGGDGGGEPPEEPEEGAGYCWDDEAAQWVPVDSFGYKPNGAAKSKGEEATGGAGSNGGNEGKGKGVVGKDGRDPSGRFRGCAMCCAMDHWAKYCPKQDAAQKSQAQRRRELNGLAEKEKEEEREKAKERARTE